MHLFHATRSRCSMHELFRQLIDKVICGACAPASVTSLVFLSWSLWWSLWCSWFDIDRPLYRRSASILKETGEVAGQPLASKKTSVTAVRSILADKDRSTYLCESNDTFSNLFENVQGLHIMLFRCYTTAFYVWLGLFLDKPYFKSFCVNKTQTPSRRPPYPGQISWWLTLHLNGSRTSPTLFRLKCWTSLCTSADCWY